MEGMVNLLSAWWYI